MKKEFVILLAILLLTSFALSADDETTTDKTSDLKDKVSSTKIGDIGAQTKEKAEGVLERKVDVPSPIEIPAKLIFGIEDGITWQRLIVLLVLWGCFYVFILSLVGLLPFFEQKWKQYIGAFLISALISFGGLLAKLESAVVYVIGDFTHNWWKYLILLVGIFVVLSLTKMLKKKLNLEKATLAGRKIGSAIASSKVVDKINKIRLGERP